MSSDEEGTKGETLEQEANRLIGLIGQTLDGYQRTRAAVDARNQSYWRGAFWKNEGISATTESSTATYQAQRNEIFPAIDSIVSALALDLPQVEAIDQRVQSYATSTRATGRTQVGRRLAAPLNWFASLDAMDKLVRECVLIAEVFDAGGVVKTTWSPGSNRVKWRALYPWQVHFDPNAKRIEDAMWSFERFPLHIDEFTARLESNVYEAPKKPIRADTYPRDLVSDALPYDDDEALKRQGIKDQVTLVEFWDYRRKLIFHIHADSRTVLSRAPMPYSRPYELLVFHPGLARLRGVSTVSHLAPVQRDINELTAARREIVARLPRRMLMDRAMFQNEQDFERFKNSKTWDPALFDGADMDIAKRVFVTPEMNTTFDFNQHRNDDIEHVRFLAGNGDARGVVRNIRTAAEVEDLSMTNDARTMVKVRLVTSLVTSLFERAQECFRWAIQNPDVSGIDLAAIVNATIADYAPEAFANEVLKESVTFRVLPFSPGMEDKNVRRKNLLDLLDRLARFPDSSSEIAWRETTRECFELFGLPPECLLPPRPPPEPAPPEPPPAPEAAPQPDPSAALGLPPGIDPGAIMSALAQAGPAIAEAVPQLAQTLGAGQG